MKIKTSELTGAALDWAVAKCEGVTEHSMGKWKLHKGKHLQNKYNKVVVQVITVI
jgi:hypothetical protein